MRFEFNRHAVITEPREVADSVLDGRKHDTHAPFMQTHRHSFVGNCLVAPHALYGIEDQEFVVCNAAFSVMIKLTRWAGELEGVGLRAVTALNANGFVQVGGTT